MHSRSHCRLQPEDFRLLQEECLAQFVLTVASYWRTCLLTAYPVAGYPDSGYPDSGYPDSGYPVTGYTSRWIPCLWIPQSLDTLSPDTPVTGYHVSGYHVSGYLTSGYLISGYPVTGYGHTTLSLCQFASSGEAGRAASMYNRLLLSPFYVAMILPIYCSCGILAIAAVRAAICDGVGDRPWTLSSERYTESMSLWSWLLPSDETGE